MIKTFKCKETKKIFAPSHNKSEATISSPIPASISSIIATTLTSSSCQKEMKKTQLSRTVRPYAFWHHTGNLFPNWLCPLTEFKTGKGDPSSITKID